MQKHIEKNDEKNYENLTYNWTVSCDASGTYRLTEVAGKKPPLTLITSANRENFYDMLDKRRDRYAAEGLLVALHDTTQGQAASVV